ncbi:MAG: hypothetical protein AB7G52_08905 [Arcobacter sp.]
MTLEDLLVKNNMLTEDLVIEFSNCSSIVTVYVAENEIFSLYTELDYHLDIETHDLIEDENVKQLDELLKVIKEFIKIYLKYRKNNE